MPTVGSALEGRPARAGILGRHRWPGHRQAPRPGAGGLADAQPAPVQGGRAWSHCCLHGRAAALRMPSRRVSGVSAVSAGRGRALLRAVARRSCRRNVH